MSAIETASPTRLVATIRCATAPKSSRAGQKPVLDEERLLNTLGGQQ